MQGSCTGTLLGRFAEGFLEEEHLSRAWKTQCHFPQGMLAPGLISAGRHVCKPGTWPCTADSRVQERVHLAWEQVRRGGMGTRDSGVGGPQDRSPWTPCQGLGVGAREGKCWAEMQGVCVSKTAETWALHPAVRSGVQPLGGTP